MALNLKKSALLPIFFVVAVDVLGLTIIIPFLPFYAQRFGASPFSVGLLISAYAFFQLISGPILGSWSDRFGRRRVLLISQLGTFIGFFILARATTLWVIFLSRIIDGSTAGNISVAQAYIADVTEPENRAKSFAVIGIAFGLGFLVGPAISGFLAQYGSHYPIYLAMTLSAMSIALTYFVLPEPSVHVDSAVERKLSIFRWGSYTEKFKDPTIGLYLFQFLAFHIGFSLFFSGFPLFAERRFFNGGMPFGPKEVGYVFAYSGLIGLIVQGGLIGRMVKKFGEAKIIVFAFAVSMVGYALLGASYHVPLLILSATFSTFGHSALRPALTALISRKVERHQQGMIMGLTQSLNSLAQIVAPMIAGIMIQRGWLSVWALTSALASFFGLTLILKANRRDHLISSLNPQTVE